MNSIFSLKSLICSTLRERTFKDVNSGRNCLNNNEKVYNSLWKCSILIEFWTKKITRTVWQVRRIIKTQSRLGGFRDDGDGALSAPAHWSARLARFGKEVLVVGWKTWAEVTRKTGKITQKFLGIFRKDESILISLKLIRGNFLQIILSILQLEFI